MNPRIGVVALQGGVIEHVRMLFDIECLPVQVRLPEHLSGLEGLILPGGESTALIRLLERWGLLEAIREACLSGLPVWGTCAGAVLLCEEVTEKEHIVRQNSLGLAPVRAERNSFGRQVASFQEDLLIKGLEEPFPGVFIRAPLLHPLDETVEVLSEVSEGAVFLRRGNVWLSSFHPELTVDSRIHRLFLRESGIGS
jgi:pyridoxal 5'-phosphate synthase pdxT subunit